MKLSPEVIGAAQAAEGKWGIPASISLAQYALESGWGEHMPPSSDNPFGIKALPGQPSVVVSTREVDKYGRAYYINAGFRKFLSLAQAFEEHGRLLATAGAYVHARAKLPDVDAFADALTGVYATDPEYGRSLKAIMHGSGLYAYNAKAAQAAVPQSSLATAVAHLRSAVAPPSESDLLNQHQLDMLNPKHEAGA